jgi:hypothetical protein
MERKIKSIRIVRLNVLLCCRISTILFIPSSLLSNLRSTPFITSGFGAGNVSGSLVSIDYPSCIGCYCIKYNWLDWNHGDTTSSEHGFQPVLGVYQYSDTTTNSRIRR